MTAQQDAAAVRRDLVVESTASLRLATVRRLYFYLVALISVSAALGALDGLLASIADAWFPGPMLAVVSGPDFVRRSIAANAGLLVVATPIFLIHWAAIQARIADSGERAAAMRKFFLYVASAVVLSFALVRAHNLLGGIAMLALGQDPDVSEILPAAWFHFAGSTLAAGLLLWYWQSVARSDGDYGLEVGDAAFWRRLFLAGAALTGLAMAIFGSAGLLTALLQRVLDAVAGDATLIGPGWFALRAGNGLSLLLLGLLTVRAPWQSWRAVSVRRPAAIGLEDESALLRLFLYVGVIGGALATLVPATVIVRELLLWGFDGFVTRPLLLIDRLAGPLGFVPAGVVIWRQYARRVRALEVAHDAGDEQGAAATVRRIYFYAVAATGLVLVWIGTVSLVQVVLDQLLTADQLKQGLIWKQPLATGLSLVAVGLPVWMLHWRAVQGVAREESEAGAAERESLPRKVYLYSVAFAGAILIVFYLAQVIYRLFLYLLGDTSVPLFSPEMAEELARSAIAALLWGVHLLALRADGARAEQDRALRQRSAAETPATGPRELLLRRVESLERELTAARAELAALDEAER